jgi:hypothetical protein
MHLPVSQHPAPITTKEPYYRGKRDLLQKQKRPTTEAKEPYVHVNPPAPSSTHTGG